MAPTWPEELASGSQSDWEFVTIIIGYLDHCDLIEHFEQLQCDDARDSEGLQQLVNQATFSSKTKPRTTGLVSLKIGKQVLSPKRTKEEEKIIDSSPGTTKYITISRIRDGVPIDIPVLSANFAEHHFRFLTTTTADVDW
ncbi:hypothetical protein C8R42DRAFT_649016 [Lentinula raphanica]|nr:hypothetical protein C8R42DRAFT_649016 [Lentinula raphanica]